MNKDIEEMISLMKIVRLVEGSNTARVIIIHRKGN